MKSFSERVYFICKQIPEGKISCYRDIAHALKCKAYRAVGQVLRKNPYAPQVPCYRVVSSKGGMGGFGGETSGKKIKEKIKLLEKEGVKVKNNKVVDFEKKLFKFK